MLFIFNPQSQATYLRSPCREDTPNVANDDKFPSHAGQLSCQPINTSIRAMNPDRKAAPPGPLAFRIPAGKFEGIMKDPDP